MILADALVSMVALVVLGWLIYGPWQTAWTDYGRQILFEARAKIFDLAIEGKIGFNSVEYRTIRTSLESSIRFAHTVTWPRLLSAYYFWGEYGQGSRKSALQNAIDQIENASTRTEVERLVGEAYLGLARMIFYKSPILLLFLLVAFVLSRLFNGSQWVQEKALETGELAQMEAERADSALACSPA
jgi:hypothetical protein